MSPRPIWLGPGVCGVFIALTAALSFDGVPGGRPMSLDLPAGGDPGEEREEENEEALEVILFFGTDLEGDAFFFCLDRSGSMRGQKIQILKEEVLQVLRSLSREAEFGVISFSRNTTRWRDLPATMSPENKADAEAWITQLRAGGGTYITGPVISTLRLAEKSQKQSRNVVVVSDGLPADYRTAIDDITNANDEEIPIHTVMIGRSAGLIFMQTLAALNQGQFSHVAD